MDWNQVFAAGVVGAVLGGGGFLLKRLHARWSARLGAVGALLAIVAIGGALVLAVSLSPVGARLEAYAAKQRAQGRIARLGTESMKPVLESPEFKERIESLSPAQVRELSMQLSAQGLLRLPDAELVRRMQLVHEALAATSEATCAAVLVQPTPDQLVELLGALPDDSLRQWMQMSASASLASLRELPARTPDPTEVQAAVGALLAALPAEEATRLQAFLQKPAELDTANACWTARTLYRTAVALPSEERALVARVLAVE